MQPTLSEIAELLLQQKKITIISHRAPDGDTLGSAMALLRGLKQLGKSVDFLCNDFIHRKYHMLFSGIESLMDRKEDPIASAKDRFLISVDIADKPLFGEMLLPLADRIDLCIDHHKMHRPFGKVIYREADAAATGEIIYALLQEMNVTITPEIATCIYTAITTDTGCFKYNNTTPRSYRIAADMVELGAPASEINRIHFDTITRPRLELQKLAIETLQYHYHGKCVTMVISREMMKKAEAKGEDVEGINTIPRQIEGTLVGITIRERKIGGYKISMRSQPMVDSASICAIFGGGGHTGAAGCVLEDSLEVTQKKLVDAVGDYFRTHGLLP